MATLAEVIEWNARDKADRAAKGLPPLTFPVKGKGRPATAKTAPPAPCARLGPPTGQTRPCQGCGGTVQQVPLHVCGTFGVCTTNKLVKLEDGTPVACCAAMCKSYEPPAAPAATA